MAPARNTVYFVTGANRGIGLGLVLALLARPRTTVIATVRSPAAASTLSSATTSAPHGESSTLHILQLDFTTAVPTDSVRAALTAATADGPPITAVDVLVCNAGSATPFSRALDTTAADLRQCFETNAIAPLGVVQGLWPLLQAAGTEGGRRARVLVVSSSVGSIGGMEPMPGGAYGASKAALNWLVRALHKQGEEGGPVVAAVHPGWVQTAMGEYAASEWGFDGKPPHTTEESVEGILKLADGEPEKIAGKFVAANGEELPW